MIKFFQKLKAKKGFTLVELIVVIAIIGVLAAILVPTMLGYVTNSRVTSADSTAASLAKEIDSFLTDCDTNGYGMKKGVAYDEGKIAVSGGTWTITLTNGNATNYNSASGVSWTTSGAGSATDAKTSASGNATKLMAIQLAGLFPDIQDGNVAFALSGGHCIACAFTSDSSVITVGSIFNITAAAPATGAAAKLTNKTSSAWDGNTAGVTTGGVIIGTNPKLGLSLGT